MTVSRNSVSASQLLSNNGLGSVGLSTLNTSGSQLVSGASSAVDTHVVFWETNPYGWSSASRNITAPVTSVELYSSGGQPIAVSSLGVPSVVVMPLLATTNVFEFECVYWSSSEQRWARSGAVVIGFEVSADGSGATRAICGALHFTDFSAAQAALSFYSVTNVETSDVGSIEEVFSPQNVVVVLTVSGFVVLFFASWVISAREDERLSKEYRELQRAHLALFGEMRTGLGMHCLHLSMSHPARVKVARMYGALKVRVTMTN